MFKLITKKEYEEMQHIIKEQDEQIEELIGMLKEALASRDRSIKCYINLVKIINEKYADFPTEIRELIDEMLKP